MKILKTLSLAFFVSVFTFALIAPATVSAAEGDDCFDAALPPSCFNQSLCAAGEQCVRNPNDATPTVKCDAESYVCTSPQGSDFGLGSDFSDVGLGKTDDLKGSIADIINVVLGFLGIVAVIIILAGGFKWMTAGGNEDQVGEARKMIIGGVIGLAVIFAAWAIAAFVISNLLTATT